MLFYNLNNFLGKQIARYCSIIVPYYPNKFSVQEQMEKCFFWQLPIRTRPTKADHD